MKIFTNSKIVLYLLVIIGLLYFMGNTNRPINGDEAIIAEHSYWLNQVGFVKSRIFVGMGQDWENRQYHYHKLFVLTGALGVKLFGFKLIVFRCITMLFLLLFIFFLWLYFKKEQNNLPKNSEYIVLLLILLNSFVFQSSFIFRPEIMLMSIGFMSFYFLIKALQTNKYRHLIISSVLSGLATFTHLNGLIFIAAGGSVLLWNKRWIHAFVFGIIGGLVSLLYLFDINSLAEFEMLRQQLFNDPNVKSGGYKYLNIFVKLITEHKRFFHSPREIIFSLLFILSVSFNFRKIKQKHLNTLIYLIVLIISLALFSHGKTAKYAIAYYPFMAYFIMLWIIRFKESPKYQKVLIVLLMAFYLMINSVYYYDIVKKQEDMIESSQEISNFFPNTEETILAYEGFIFNQIENYSIDSYWGYLLLCTDYLGEKPSFDTFFNFVNKYDYTYIIFNLNTHIEFMKELDLFTAYQGRLYDNYKVLKSNKEYVILERLKNS